MNEEKKERFYVKRRGPRSKGYFVEDRTKVIYTIVIDYNDQTKNASDARSIARLLNKGWEAENNG